ncbi:hypothetical protein [Kitasatospora sp. NPDC101183]|uniref:hypothetical protein n=1 Tax=Kitasatospora sp. NPDC101183 TaxID=3364100 RepID=UPI0038018714
MTGDHLYDDEYTRRLKAHQNRDSVVKLFAVLAVCGWLWAAALMFLPADDRYDCGSPATYESARSGSTKAQVCDARMAARTRESVTLLVLVLPLTAAWGWSASTLRDLRERLREAEGR